MTTRGKPTKEDLIYAAAFMDGEGHILIYKGIRGGKYKSPTYILIVGCTNTNKDIINWFQLMFGASRSIRKRRKNHPKWKTCYSWTIQAKKALVFLESILPYMKIKKTQAEIAIEFQKGIYHKQDRKGRIRRVSEKENQRREKLYLKLKSLK